MRPPIVTIAGAGPAGLAAAIVLARAGLRVVVYERRTTVGGRFHGDYQGLENWSTGTDVIEDLAATGIQPSFEASPFREVVLFGPGGRAYHCRDAEPLFYLVRRGAGLDTLDTALLQQARAAGAEVQFGAACEQLPHGGIAATGPHRADVIAAGYVFDTEMADGAFVVASRALAGAGYGYLLVHRGRGTLACCLFTDFHAERAYLAATVDFFARTTGVRMRNARSFGGSGCVSLARTAVKGGILYAGEAAGFQDALAGFGMRYALHSGTLAARALATGNAAAYDALWRASFGGPLRAGFVNRWLFAAGGDLACRLVLRFAVPRVDLRAWVRRRYRPGLVKTLLFPLAAHAFLRRTERVREPAGCDCTWCRCQRGGSSCPQNSDP